MMPPRPTRVLRPRISKTKGVSKPLPQVCHFFRIPLELRREIYRWLLTPYYPRILNLRKIADFDPGQYPDWPLQTAILRANRQIYSEASHILYSEVKIILYPGDLVCLRANAEDIAQPSQNIWRHNPLNGIGKSGPHNEGIYTTPEMDGLMDPHVFARFKRVNLELRFEFDPDECPRFRPLGIDSEMKIERKECIRFQNFLRRTNVLRDFKQVISNSPVVDHLGIRLSIFACPAYNEDLEDDAGSLPEVYFRETDTRAAEMFIESGVMDPLRSLTNIDLVTVQAVGSWDSEPQTLKPKYEQLLRELEDDIEGDWDWSDSEDEDSDEGDSVQDRSDEEKDSDDRT